LDVWKVGKNVFTNNTHAKYETLVQSIQNNIISNAFLKVGKSIH